jgi:hypothetical protein
LESVDYDEDEQNEWKLAKFFFVADSTTTLTLFNDVMTKVPKVKVILDLWNLFKRDFEFCHLLDEQVEGLQRITCKQFLIPEVVADYCFLSMTFTYYKIVAFPNDIIQFMYWLLLLWLYLLLMIRLNINFIPLIGQLNNFQFLVQKQSKVFQSFLGVLFFWNLWIMTRMSKMNGN